jgi:hypothetical protein
LLGDAISVKQQKTDEPLTVPCRRTLREALDNAPGAND